MFGVKQKWLIFIALACAAVMVDVDMTAINLAVHTIANSLSMSVATAKWVVDGYTIAAACLMAFGGSCADNIGDKKVFQTGLVAFMLASLAVGLSQGPVSIIVSRIIQGGCIAFTFPVAMTIAQRVFPQEQQGMAIGLLISIAGVSQALGPTIGGAIIHLLSWRWIFLLNIPVAVLSLVIMVTCLPAPQAKERQPIKISLLVPLIVGLFALITAFNEFRQLGGITSLSFLGLIVLAIISLSLFAYRELNHKTPILDLRILASPAVNLVMMMRLLINFTYFGWLFLLGILLQQTLGYSAFLAGVIMMSLTLVIAVLSGPVGKMIDKIGSYKVAGLGLVLALIANVMLGMFVFFHPTWYLCLSLLVAGLAAALLIPSNATACMGALPPEKAGAGMGMLFTAGFIGSALGVAILGTIAEGQASFLIGFGYCMMVAAGLSIICLLMFASLIKHAKKQTA